MGSSTSWQLLIRIVDRVIVLDQGGEDFEGLPEAAAKDAPARHRGLSRPCLAPDPCQ